MKRLFPLLLLGAGLSPVASAVTIVPSGVTIVQEAFDGPTLADTLFTAAGRQPFTVDIAAGRLSTTADVQPGLPLTFGVASAGLDGTAIAGYPNILDNAKGTVSWSFDLQYFDGTLNGSYVVQLAVSEADRLSGTVDGYVLVGGGQAGDTVTLGRLEDGLIVGDIIVSPLGPAPGDEVRLQVDLDPGAGTWTLSSTDLSGSGGGSSVLGSGMDGNLLNTNLPYFSLGSTTTGTAHYDNFQLDVIPEPATSTILLVAGMLFVTRRSRPGSRS